MKNHRIKTYSHFGFSTILIIFSMVCIITFATLSFITANSDYKLSQKVMEKNQNYYSVESKAYEKLSEIDNNLYSIYSNSANYHDYKSTVETYLNSLDYGNVKSISLNNAQNQLAFEFSEDISDTSNLCVTLVINYPVNNSSGFYKITQWQIIQDTDTVEDNTLNLIGD